MRGRRYRFFSGLVMLFAYSEEDASECLDGSYVVDFGFIQNWRSNVRV